MKEKRKHGLGFTEAWGRGVPGVWGGRELPGLAGGGAYSQGWEWSGALLSLGRLAKWAGWSGGSEHVNVVLRDCIGDLRLEVCMCPMALVTHDQKPNGLKPTHLFSRHSGGQESKVGRTAKIKVFLQRHKGRICALASPTF